MKKLKELLNYKNKIIAVDIDGTITNEKSLPDFSNISMIKATEFFKNSTPNKKIIENINKLYKNNFIIIYTTRDSYHYNTTIKWLKDKNVKYNRLVMNKLYFDLLIDDKVLNVEDLK